MDLTGEILFVVQLICFGCFFAFFEAGQGERIQGGKRRAVRSFASRCETLRSCSRRCVADSRDVLDEVIRRQIGVGDEGLIAATLIGTVEDVSSDVSDRRMNASVPRNRSRILGKLLESRANVGVAVCEERVHREGGRRFR